MSYDPDDYFNRPKTNGEKLRSLPDKELVKYLRCPRQFCGNIKSESCEECLLKWLKERA